MRVKQFRNLIEALEAAPADRPFVTLWVEEDEHETVTFGEFRDRAAAQAQAFEAQNIGAGDRVIIIMPQGIAAMTGFAGAMMLGAIPAFLAYPNFKVEPSKYRAGLAGVTANLGARAVVIDDEFPDDLLRHVTLGETTRLIRALKAEKAPSHGARLTAQERVDDLAFIQHSAGTTGLQKGVALTHAAVLRQLEHLSDALKIDGTKDRIYSWLPLYHDMGLIACFMLPMVCHVPVVMQSPLDWVIHPETALQIISDFRCTLAWMPNFAFQFIPRRTKRRQWENCNLSSLRALINCSEPVRATSLQEFEDNFSIFGLKKGVLHSSYAMAENVFAVTQSDVSCAADPLRIWIDGPYFRVEHRVSLAQPGTADAISFVSSGNLLPGNQIQILSSSGDLLPDGQIGEILMKSDSLFTGYYNRPDLTANAIVDGWYHTGDLGFLWEGQLFIVGRKKDLLIVGGENLYPQDIEEIVAAHPAVHDGRAVAMGIFNPDVGTEEIVVVAEVEREDLLQQVAIIESEIRSQIVESLGIAVRTIFLKPPKWIVKSTAGKPARSATREKLLAETPSLKTDFLEAKLV